MYIRDVSLALLARGALRGMSSVDMQLGWRERGKASVLGITFVGGEPMSGVRRKGWSNYRCSSVCTTVIKESDGSERSRYGLIKSFIERVDGEHDKYAIIEWLPIPTYPYSHPLIVLLRDGDGRGNLSTILPLRDIDPCVVMLERCDLETGTYVIRLDGLDIMP